MSRFTNYIIAYHRNRVNSYGLIVIIPIDTQAQEVYK